MIVNLAGDHQLVGASVLDKDREPGARQRNAPRAQPEQQLRPDRPVDPHRAGIWSNRRRERADQTAALAIGDGNETEIHGRQMHYAAQCRAGVNQRKTQSPL